MNESTNFYVVQEMSRGSEFLQVLSQPMQYQLGDQHQIMK